jgi:hypothetical protein
MSENENSIKIDESIFGKLTDERHELKTVKKFTLTNKTSGFSVSLLSYGATLHAIHVKDKSGHVTNVALGFECLQGWFRDEHPKKILIILKISIFFKNVFSNKINAQIHILARQLAGEHQF